jgi:hypothetical protein
MDKNDYQRSESIRVGLCLLKKSGGQFCHATHKTWRVQKKKKKLFSTYLFLYFKNIFEKIIYLFILN